MKLNPTFGDDVLIVVPCLNEVEHLPRIIASLLSDRSAEGFLIVIADGGSTDGTCEIARTAAEHDGRIKFLENPERLQSAGINLAARCFGSGRRWLVRLDAHADYPRHYVSRLVQTALRTGATSVVVPMLARGRGWFQLAVATAQNSRIGTGGAQHRRLSCGGWIDHGHHGLMDLAAFLRLGGYDETFAANEDAELDVRLTKSGGKIWLAEDLPLAYHPRRTAAALFRQYLRHGAGRARTILRHRLRPKGRQLLPLTVAPAVLMLLLALLIGPGNAPLPLLLFLVAPAVSWAAICLTYGAWLGIKARDQSALTAGVAAMIMHFGWSVGFWSRLARGPGPEFVAMQAGETATD